MPVGGVGEQVLLGEDGLAGSGRPKKEVDCVGHETTAQCSVQPIGATRQSVGHVRTLPKVRARAEEVLHRRDQLERLQGLLEEGVCSSRQGFVAGLERRDGEDPTYTPLAESLAQLGARSSRDEKVDNGQLRGTLLGLELRLIEVESEHCGVAFGAKEVLAELRREWISLSQHDQETSLLGVRRSQPTLLAQLVRQEAEGVARRRSLLDLTGDEPELLYVVPGIEAMAAIASLGRHDAVALLPGPQPGWGNTEHPSHRADAVDARILVSHPTRLPLQAFAGSWTSPPPMWTEGTSRGYTSAEVHHNHTHNCTIGGRTPG